MAADNSVYLSGNIGLGMAMDSDIDNMPENAGTAKMTLDAGFLGTAAVGYDFAGPFRAEAEYGWQKNDLDTLSYSNRIGNINQGDLKTQSMMVNGYYDVDTGSPWSPFVGAGIGWAKVDLNTPALPFGDNDDVFAYQFMAGVAYNVSANLAIDAQYRFFGTQDATIQDADFSMNSNDLMLGLRYSF
jgi:opacity protein-like surface antigen